MGASGGVALAVSLGSGFVGLLFGSFLTYYLGRHAAEILRRETNYDEATKEAAEKTEQWRQGIDSQLARMSQQLHGQREQIAIFTGLLQYVNPDLKDFIASLRIRYRDDAD